MGGIKYVLLLCFFALVGCTSGLDDFSEEGGSAFAEQEVVGSNLIVPNTLVPPDLTPSDIAGAPLSIDAMPASSVAALQDPGQAGDVSRLFVRYAVGCAFDTSQSFSFTWTDEFGTTHEENYPGLLGLASSWATAPLGDQGQRWVSACLAARTNYYGIAVIISMRASHQAMQQLDGLEKAGFPMEEGAFWGNLFLPMPFVRACHYAPNDAHSRSLMRDCAAGHVGDAGIDSCGIIQRVGSCNDVCSALDPTNLYHTSCTLDPSASPAIPVAEVITVYLK